MKLNKGRLEIAFHQMWTVVAVIVLFVNDVGGIRVYEGTNEAAPPPKVYKSAALTKKSLLISKRSWTPVDESLKASSKADRRSDGKWKEFSKRTGGLEGAPHLYKIKFSERRQMQYLKYVKEIPRLEEYTFCLWYQPTNLTRDQTLFSYSLNKNERLLKFWINEYDSTLQMAIREVLAYKVPTNIREHRWYHICQSWNGVLGEWQVFLDGKRIGSGVLSHYKGTYIPEGGEVTLGPDAWAALKGSDDGLDGELFGFNLVDEAVPQTQAVFLNSQYRPKLRPASVPPFKKLPPIKKTYQEIKAYLSTLPTDSAEIRGSESAAYPAEEPNVIKKAKDPYVVPTKRNRGNHRIRYPPLRKVVVYNRDDRKLGLDGFVEINKTKPTTTRTKPTTPRPMETTFKPKKTSQVFDENYSIHSYRFEKKDKTPNYEIYEVLEEEPIGQRAEDRLSGEESMEKNARDNFNLYTAREANKVYTLSTSVKDFKKPRFHFERMAESIQRDKIDRSSIAADRKSGDAKEEMTDSKPVYEEEVPVSRRKREAEKDSNGFRRLPEIPESFISIFTKNASKTEIEEKLSEFFPKNASTEESNILPQVTEAPQSVTTVSFKFLPPIAETSQEEQTTTEKIGTSQLDVESSKAPAYDIPLVGKTSQIKRTYLQGDLTDTAPASFPVQVQDFDPRLPLDVISPAWKAEISADRRKFDISLGTDLVMRSYGICTADRGSPVQDKTRLVLSWADTPVRIYGGAQVEMARNECGNF